MPGRIVVAVVIHFAMIAANANADVFDLAIRESDIDLARCVSYENGKPRSVASEVLLGTLGLAPTPERAWAAGFARDDHKLNFAYVVAFKQPVSPGAILMHGEVHDLAILPADAAAVPKSPDDPAWKQLARPVGNSGVTYVLPPGQRIRAIRVTDSRGQGPSQLVALRLFKSRLHSITPLGMAYASREFYRPPADASSAFLYEAALITKGTGAWYSAGKNSKQTVNTPVISDISPEWFMLAWHEPQTLSGLWLDTNLETWQLETFAGPENVNPRAGLASEWKKVRDLTAETGGGLWIEFAKPITTRSLRFKITKVSGNAQIAWIASYHAFADAGDKALPELATANQDRPNAPFTIPYQVEKPGTMTMVVKDAQGRTVRNLFARRSSQSGKFTESWDLKDENGHFVSPGEYKWLAMHYPVLTPKYEFTVYPNVEVNSPENTPWLTGMNGAGGWMADHSPPNSVCTSGKNVFLGAPVSENGVTFIATDLTGKKLWAHHSFASWTGPKFLAADEKKVYVAATILDDPADNIWTVDIASKEVEELCRIEPTTSRRRGMKGLAIRDGKIYVSVNAKQDWFAGAASAEDVDIASCVPLYPPPRRKKGANDVVAEPRRDFISLFRMHPNPPGLGMPGSLTYLETEKGTKQRQHVVLAFAREVPIGSLAFPFPEEPDIRLRLSVLREGGTYPPLASDESQWQQVPLESPERWTVLPLPENLETRALRLTFIKGDEEDALLASSDSLDISIDGPRVDRESSSKELIDGFGKDSDAWVGRLEGMKLLRRRFKNVAGSAKIRVNSGQVSADGTWDAQRDRTLTESDPGIYVLEWSKPQSIRGLAIREIDGQFTKVDVYEGPAGEIDIAGAKGWKEVATYEQQRRDVVNGYGLGMVNAHARYVDGYVDFGREIKTRAVRLRVVQQWADKGQAGCMGIRQDLGGGTLDPRRCRVFGVAAVEYLGGEAPLDALAFERVEVYSTSGGKLLGELPLQKPERIGFDPKGRLHAISNGALVRIDSKKPVPFITDLEQPTDFCFDRAGNIYVFDAGKGRNNIRIYDAAGKLQRTIGKPGGFVMGAWDPERLGQVADIDIDENDQLWAVETQYHPKRITQWTTAGKFLREHLGNTPYGGAGVLDPYDKTRLYYEPLEFELDWQTGKSRIKNLTWIGNTPAGDMPIHVGKHAYMVNRPRIQQQAIGVVYLYEKDHLKLAAAVGNADAFEPLKTAEIVIKADKPLSNLWFMWSDLNGDGKVDADETQFSPRKEIVGHITMFDRDLGIQAGPIRWQVKKILPTGVPIYQQLDFPRLAGEVKRLADGNFFIMGDGGEPERVVTLDGKSVWTYPSTGAGLTGVYKSQAYRPDECLSEFTFAGHEPAGDDEVGEVLCFHTNAGQWNLWTADGLFLGPLFSDNRAPGARPWSMRQHDRGMLMTNVAGGGEHFHGYFCRSQNDGKYYAVAGHNHISVVEVPGLKDAKRMHGKVTVAATDLLKAQSYELKSEAAKSYARAPVIDCYRLPEPPVLDGKLEDWTNLSATIGTEASLRMGYTDDYLFLAYRTQGLGPFKNTGTQWDRLFKSGAAIDLQIGVDPSAKIDRDECAAGDQRLLMTMMDSKAIGVLYRPVSPNATVGDHWEVVSPVAKAEFDEVRRAEGVQLIALPHELGSGYDVEVAIPLAVLGWKPADGQRLRMDWGVLVTGPDGNEVIRRLYWANKATGIVNDAPSEAILQPPQWGYLLVHDRARPSAEDQFKTEIITTKKAQKDVKDDVDDILDTLDADK